MLWGRRPVTGVIDGRRNHMEKDVSGEAREKCHCYVIQTFTGQEETLLQFIHVQVNPSLYEEVFVPKREMNRRLGGEWRMTVEKMFPGYVFIHTSCPDELFLSLRNIPKMSRLLYDGAYEFIALSAKEQRFIDRIGQGRGDHTFRSSKVEPEEEHPYHKGDRVRILEGDLKNFEGELIGYNLRKRKAIIRTQMFGGRDVYIHVGIEIIKNIQFPCIKD